jgi:hypothetical protein
MLTSPQLALMTVTGQYFNAFVTFRAFKAWNVYRLFWTRQAHAKPLPSQCVLVFHASKAHISFRHIELLRQPSCHRGGTQTPFFDEKVSVLTRLRKRCVELFSDLPVFWLDLNLSRHLSALWRKQRRLNERLTGVRGHQF